jgi:hypothetical protein
MIDFDSFSDAAVVSDFVVRLVDTPEGGLHLEFASASHGRLAWFPAWDHADRDLRHFVAGDVPLGTPDEPYDDRDEEWRIVIFESGGWVWIGEADDPNAEEMRATFRVPRARYLQAWAAIIDHFNPITPMEDPS